MPTDTLLLRITALSDQMQASAREELDRFNSAQLFNLMEVHAMNPIGVTLSAVANHSAMLATLAACAIANELQRRIEADGECGGK